mmetsp:Transcript_12859/g.33012  ORF Transcript_12859/g.33012 Transcript_12859/m.33012 type:complete len:241 (-) Transcript_12859:259-981(-)
MSRQNPRTHALSTAAQRLPALGASFSSARLYMRSSAAMFSNVSLTAAGSEPSQRSAVMGPCSSLFMMPRLSSSSAFFCFLVSPSPIDFIAFSSSAVRMSSALLRSALMVGTVSRLSRHDSNAAISSISSASASIAAWRRAALLACTTSFRSSTLYTTAPSTSLMSCAMLRGTLMSTKRRCPSATPQGAMPAMSTFSSSSVSLPLAANTRSAASVASMSLSIRWISMVTSGKSAASASARG